MIAIDKESTKRVGTTMFTLRCSKCGKIFIFPDGHTHMAVPETGRRKAVLYGWSCTKSRSSFFTGGADYCEKCKEKSEMGVLTDYANNLIDKCEARKKKMEEWKRHNAGGKEPDSKEHTPLLEIPLKTAPIPKDGGGKPAQGIQNKPERPDIPLEPMHEVLRFAFCNVTIYPGMDKK